VPWCTMLHARRGALCCMHAVAYYVDCVPWCTALWCTMLHACRGVLCCMRAVVHHAACVPWCTMLHACRDAPCCMRAVAFYVAMHAVAHYDVACMHAVVHYDVACMPCVACTSWCTKSRACRDALCCMRIMMLHVACMP
jgi:hypothetical protein